MLAPFAAKVSSARKCWITDAFGINVKIFGFLREIGLIHAVVHLAALLHLLATVAKLAFILQHVAVTGLELPRLEHVVALGAEAHALKFILSQ